MSSDLLTDIHKVSPRHLTYGTSNPLHKRKGWMFCPSLRLKTEIQKAKQSVPSYPRGYESWDINLRAHAFPPHETQSPNYSLTHSKNELEQTLVHEPPLPCLARSLRLFMLAKDHGKAKCQDTPCSRHCQQNDPGKDALLQFLFQVAYFKHKSSLDFHHKLLELEM